MIRFRALMNGNATDLQVSQSPKLLLGGFFYVGKLGWWLKAAAG
jgi:hypothetical protein